MSGAELWIATKARPKLSNRTFFWSLKLVAQVFNTLVAIVNIAIDLKLASDLSSRTTVAV